MAYYHFNGDGEQSARNRHGAIARNFYGSAPLGVRLSCKPATQYNRVVSGALVPLAYDEDAELVTEYRVTIRRGYKANAEVHAYANAPEVYAVTRPAIGQAARKRLPAAITKAIKTLANPRKNTNTRAKAAAMIDDFVSAKGNALLSRKLYKQFASGKVSGFDALRAAGVVTIRI